MSESAQQFTAARIANRLGKPPRVVRRWLKSVAPDGSQLVQGNLAAAWKLESLPTHVLEQLTAVAGRSGCRSPLELLAGNQEPWAPAIPWGEVCEDHQRDALKLQRALMPLIERRNDTSISPADFDALGARTYTAEFSRPISPARWRYLFDRTLSRDAGAGQFHRPELFLPGNLKRAASDRTAGPGDTDFEPLNLCLGHFADPLQPTGAEIDALWIEAVELFAELAESERPKQVKRRVLDFLWKRAPFLAKSFNALRVNFDRKVKTWRESDAAEVALLDGRELRRGESQAAAIPQQDVDRVAWHSARNCGGRTAQAVRELAAAGEGSGLSPATFDLINAPHASKSHVNRRLFAAVHPDVQLIAPFLLGKKAKDDATPSLRRDYSKLRSMTALTADDFTMPAYCFVPDGKGWWMLTRGQVLLCIDCRSLKIVGWSLQPERNYNSLVIRTLMNRTCQQWGLPRVWLFENGLWRNSHVVKGPPREWSEGKSWAEYRPGWAQLGVKFIHAKRARSKPAELVGGLLQNLMERVPGYCGRDERRDCPEATKRNKLAVEAGRIEPHGLFLSFDAWEAELGKLIATYNANVQQGEILQGMSPDQAFEAYWPHDDPPAKLDASCWHLLAHFCSERTVGVDGIKFRIGAQPYIYRDENTSALRGRTVLAWFDPECAEFLGVTDMSGRNPVLVQRESKVDFLASLDRDGESGRTYQAELVKVAAHNAYPRARFNVLKATFEPTFRKNMVAPGVAHVAETFKAERDQVHRKDQARANQASTTAARARKLGLAASLVRQGDNLEAEGTEMMLRAERSQVDARQAKSKDYVLDASKKFIPGEKGKSQ